MHDAWRAWLAVVAGIIAPLAAASALVPLRDTIDNANVALVLAAVVVAVALTGSRAAVLVAAASATVWFDFFHTRPYESFTVNELMYWYSIWTTSAPPVPAFVAVRIFA